MTLVPIVEWEIRFESIKLYNLLFEIFKIWFNTEIFIIGGKFFMTWTSERGVIFLLLCQSINWCLKIIIVLSIFKWGNFLVIIRLYIVVLDIVKNFAKSLILKTSGRKIKLVIVIFICIFIDQRISFLYFYESTLWLEGSSLYYHLLQELAWV